MSKFTPEQIEFLERVISLNVLDDDIVIAGINCDVYGCFNGKHVGDHNGDHIGHHHGHHHGHLVGRHFGDHIGDHNGDHIGHLRGIHIGNVLQVSDNEQ